MFSELPVMLPVCVSDPPTMSWATPAPISSEVIWRSSASVKKRLPPVLVMESWSTSLAEFWKLTDPAVAVTERLEAMILLPGVTDCVRLPLPTRLTAPPVMPLEPMSNPIALR